MTRAEQQLKRRFKILDDAEAILTDGITATESEIYDEILKILDRFTSKGVLIYDAEAIRMINEMEGTIRRAINRTDYPETVKDYLVNFDKIKEINIKIQQSINKIDVSSGLTSLQRGAVQQTLNKLMGTGLSTNMIQPVQEVIFQHIVAGASRSDAELALREVIKGSPERLGKLERYVGQIARDAISQYDGLIQQRILNEFELDGFSYEGSIIRDSRPQCVRWVEKFKGVLRLDQLTDEIDWAYTNGSGMIAGTTKDTFAVNKGGHRCRHSCTAIRIL